MNRIRLSVATFVLFAILGDSPFFARLQAQQTTTGKRGMVVSADSLASAVGLEILKKGGNAIDAGVGVGFALAVTFPLAGNIGGGGFMVIRLADGRTTTVDFREKAPGAASRNMYLDKKGEFVSSLSQKGPLAAGIPGSVAGLLHALDRYGTMNRATVIGPAIRLAQRGFVVRNRFFARELADSYETFKRFPASLKVFSRNQRPLGLGDTLRQEDLASTLDLVKRNGREGFYGGSTADRVAAEMNRYGGIISREDLESYSAVERPPVTGTYRGYDIISMGPPSSGGAILVEMLNILEGFNLAKSRSGTVTSATLLAEAMKIAYADRAEFLGDPDFVDVPVDRLTSKDYASVRRKKISTRRATPSAAISAGSIPRREHSETTHFSIIDRWGNCVSVTTTLNDFFGCGVMVDGAGFFLNNEMDDFSAKPGIPNQFGLVGGDANAIEPGKRMLSAMSPTIILREGKPFMVLGTPGGSRIITTMLQIAVNVIDHGMDLRKAIDAPRIHHQWRPDTLFFESGGLALGLKRGLSSKGYVLVELKGEYGRAEGILINRDGSYVGVTDRRGNGAAIGY
jgi:gamma-glutamyltranspeptidase/glutathione hydrolase